MRRVSANDKGLEVQLNQNFDELARRVDQAEGLPFAQGQIIKGVVLPTGKVTSVPHALGRAFQGWWEVRRHRSAATVWLVVEDNSARPVEAIALRSGCDVDVTVDLFVF